MKTVIKVWALTVSVTVVFAVSAAEVTLNVASGTRTVTEALADNGYSGYTSGTRLVKTGIGTLQNNDNTYDALIASTTVKAGVYEVNDNARLGQYTWKPDNIIVESGATIDFGGPNPLWLNNRCLKVAGTGAAGKGGALVFSVKGYMEYFQPELTADATFLTLGDRHCQIFNRKSGENLLARITLNGHTLTLKSGGAAASGNYGYTLNRGLKIVGNGTITLDGSHFCQTIAGAFDAQRDAGTTVALVLTNSSTFVAGAQTTVSLFDTIAIGSGCSVSGNAAEAFAVTVGGLSGTGSIGPGFSSVTIVNSLGVTVDDLKTNAALSVTGPVAFGTDAALTIAGATSLLARDADVRYTLLTSDTSVTGVPSVAGGIGAKYRAEVSADGYSLELVYIGKEKPDGAIDVIADWGLTEGLGATGNAALFQTKLADVAAGAVVYFPAGDYSFESALDLNKANVTFLGDGDDSVIHTAITVSADNVTITSLTVADTTGAAVTAANVANLTVTNAFFAAVNADYPVVVTDGTGTMVRYNRVTDDTTFTAPASITGTKAAGSEPINGEIHIWVDAGVTETYAEAFARTGFASFPSKWKLVKAGPGVLDKSTGADTGQQCTWITEGVLVTLNNNDFGNPSFGDNDIKIIPGATLRFSTQYDQRFNNRICNFAGTGAPGEGGAIHCQRGKSFTTYGQFKLDGDATIVTSADDENSQLFDGGGVNTGSCWLNGYTLTLTAKGEAAAKGYGFQLRHAWTLGDKSGTLCLDGAPLDQGTDAFIAKGTGGTVLLKLVNGAMFRPKTVEMTQLFDGLDLAYGTSFYGLADPMAVTFASLAGAGTIGTNISTVTVSDSLGVAAADLKESRALTVANALVLTGTQLFIDGDVSELVDAGQTGVVLASAEGGITGVPAVSGVSRLWKARLSNDGKQLLLVYEPNVPAGAVDVVVDWGLIPGAGATGNAALFASKLADLTGPAILYFPAAEFVFETPVTINKAGVTILGEWAETTLKGGIQVTADDVTLTGVMLGGTAGPAVVANGADNLSVTNMFFTNVVGMIDGVDGTYPVSVTNSANAMVRRNRVLDGTTYTAPVYVSASTMAAGSEPIAGELHIWVDQYETEPFMTALAKTGYAVYPGGSKLVKEGPGTLIGTNTLASEETGIKDVRIAEGVFRVLTNDDFGYSPFTVHNVVIDDGATVILAGTGQCIVNRMIDVSGSGAPGQGGAVVVAGGGNNTLTQFSLLADTTFVTTYGVADARLFSELISGASKFPSRVNYNGHTLTLKSGGAAAANGKGFAIVNRFEEVGTSGTLLVDGCPLVQAGDSAFVVDRRTADATYTLALRNGAVFKPKSQDVMGLFDRIDFESGTSLVGAGAAFALTLGDVSGPGTVSTGFTSLTITNTLDVAAADLLAERHLTASCPIIFTDTARFALTNVAELEEKGSYVIAESSVSVTGAPRKKPGSISDGWSAVVNASGTAVEIKKVGFILMIK